MADGAFLRFEAPYGPGKVYARLPGGEFAYSDSQGLYEWRRVPVPGADPRLFPDGTMLVRIDYSGGDRQASDRNGFWSHGDSASTRARVLAWQAELGFQAAVHPARMN